MNSLDYRALDGMVFRVYKLSTKITCVKEFRSPPASRVASVVPFTPVRCTAPNVFSPAQRSASE